MPESPTGADKESDQSAEHHLPPRPTPHSGDVEKAAGPSVESVNNGVVTVRALLEKQPWISQYLKNPNIATGGSKVRSRDQEPRSPERPGRQRGNDSTDDTIADDTDSLVECDVPIHRPTSSEALQMTNSPPAVTPDHPRTPYLSAITTYPQNLPTVHSDIRNSTTPKPIAAGTYRDPPAPNENHPGETRNERGEGPSTKEPKKIDSTGGTTCRRGKAHCWLHCKKQGTFFFFFITLKQFYHRFYPQFLGLQHLLHFHVVLSDVSH